MQYDLVHSVLQVHPLLTLISTTEETTSHSVFCQTFIFGVAFCKFLYQIQIYLHKSIQQEVTYLSKQKLLI